MPFGFKSRLIKRNDLVHARRIEAFASRYSAASGNHTEISYLNQCEKIRVFTCRRYTKLKGEDNRWVAGYAINTCRPFRYFEDFNHHEVLTILNQIGIESELEVCEITCIWILRKERNFKLHEWERVWIYIYSLLDALLTCKKIVIGGSIAHSYWKQLQKVLTRQLYFGHVGSMKKDEEDSSSEEDSTSKKNEEKSGSEKKSIPNPFMGKVLYQKGRGWLIFYFCRAVVIEISGKIKQFFSQNLYL